MKKLIPIFLLAAISALAQCTNVYSTGGVGNRLAGGPDGLLVTVTTNITLGGGAITTLVNGNTISSTTYFNTQSVTSSLYLRFDFGSGVSKLVTEATFIQQNTASHGVWQWQGSNNGSTWTNIGSTFTLGGSAMQAITTLSGNSTNYRYYQIAGVSGATSNGPFIYQMEFKLTDSTCGGGGGGQKGFAN